MLLETSQEKTSSFIKEQEQAIEGKSQGHLGNMDLIGLSKLRCLSGKPHTRIAVEPI